jgi:hypothetical protein
MFCNLFLLLLFPTLRLVVGDLLLLLFSEDEDDDEALFLSTFEGRKTGWLSQSVAAVGDDDEGDDAADVILYIVCVCVSFSRMID